jgi:molybdate transport system substrate-binding protein
MRRVLRPLALAAFLLAIPCFSAAATELTVFAAASLKDALDALARQFDAATGNKTAVVYAASNALAKQIESGAPADVFISADLDWPDYMDTRALLRPGSRVNLVGNELVLIAPVASATTLHIAPNFALAAALAGGKLAMANPDSVPAGRYGKSALEALGVWHSVERDVVRADNVRVALAFVARGEAPLGIVYKSDAIVDKSVRIVDTFPPDTHAPIVYPAAVVAASKSPATAQALLNFLHAEPARATWTKYGFSSL